MISQKNLESRYERIVNQLQGLLRATDNRTARMATIAALLHHKMPHFFWTGFYLLMNDKLIVGPYQGPLACQILEKGKGVCWACIRKEKAINVPDVHKFPGHIPCDARSNSEIVVPLIDQKSEAWGVLDVDSRMFNAFSTADQTWLERIVKLI